MSYKDTPEFTESPESSLNDVGRVLLRPEMDRILEALGSRYRRLILLLLKEGLVEQKVDLKVRAESDIDKTKPEIELVHNHLPRLEDAGYIKWDQETDEISKGPCFKEINPFLELLENHADELPRDWP